MSAGHNVFHKARSSILRHRERYSDRTGQGTIGQPRHITGDSGLLNLVESVKVKCTSEHGGRIWGEHEKDQAAVLYLGMMANEPPGYKLDTFELHITLLAASTFQSSGSQTTTAIPPVATVVPSHIVVPAPTYVEGQPWMRTETRGWDPQAGVQTPVVGVNIAGYHQNTEREIPESWTFVARPGGGAGEITTAVWYWSSNRSNERIEDRGQLHGGMAVRHVGQPFMLSCTPQARLRGESKYRRLRTKTAAETATVWLVEPQKCTDDVRDLVKGLDEHVKRLNQAPAARK